MGLSVCFLTRDDEAKIGRAIASVSGVADQVVVADTGSKDRTVEVAREAGAEVVEVAWDDDFGEGRNAALERASDEWVLWMNPDEELEAEGRSKLAECLAESKALGFTVAVLDQLRADRPGECSQSIDFRLYRLRPGLRYVGRLHPSIPVEALESARGAEGLEVLPSSVMLRRHAYESVLDEGKLRWALRLLDRELADRPGRLPYLIERADTLLRLNDHRGHEAMAEAAELVARHREDPGAPSEAVQVLLNYLMRAPEGQVKGPLTPGDAEELVARWFPRSPVPLWTLAETAFARGDYPRAVGLLESLIEMGQTGLYDRSRGFDPTILTRHAWANLGASLLALGRLDQAQACFQHLRDDPEARAQAEQGLAAVAARRARST